MSTIDLGITDRYCPDWGVVEGVREFVQNALDAHDRGFRMHIAYKGGVCTISNKGAKVPLRSWLLGIGDKTGDDAQRGGFCEGLAIGALALLRAGIQIVVTQPGETWHPYLALNKRLDVKTLSVASMSVAAPDAPPSYVVRLTGVTKEQMAEVQRRFLALRTKKPATIDHDRGRVLVDDEERGNIYVKGIYVGHVDDLRYGYDFSVGVGTDRDRKMADRHQTDLAMCDAWNSICRNDPRAIDLVVDMMQDSVDLQWARYSPNLRQPGGIVDQLRDRFVRMYGDDAFPVRTEGDRETLGHLGLNGVVLPTRHVELLEMRLGTMREIMIKASESILEVFAIERVDPESHKIFDRVLELLEPVAARLGYDPVRPRIRLVRFSGDCQGQYLADGKVLVIAQRLLTDPTELLATVVHEMCHERGGDGNVHFDRAQAKVLTEITRPLLEEVG